MFYSLHLEEKEKALKRGSFFVRVRLAAPYDVGMCTGALPPPFVPGGHGRAVGRSFPPGSRRRAVHIPGGGPGIHTPGGGRAAAPLPTRPAARLRGATGADYAAAFAPRHPGGKSKGEDESRKGGQPLPETPYPPSRYPRKTA